MFHKTFRALLPALLILGSVTLPKSSVSADVITPGPITRITTSPTLNCGVYHAVDNRPEWYGATACGTWILTNSGLYGPPSASSMTSNLTAGFTPISQTQSGSGVPGDPFNITTVVSFSGMTATQVDTYLTGELFYNTVLTINNPTAVTQSGLVYSAGDCYLNGSDSGYGAIDSSTPGGPSPVCQQTPGGRNMSLEPITTGSNYQEGYYYDIRNRINSRVALTNGCSCSGANHDMGMGLSWPLSLAASTSTSYSWNTRFSYVDLSVFLQATPDQEQVSPSTQDGYTINMSNLDIDPSHPTSFSVTLPQEFTYTPGSTTGVFSNEPTITTNGSGQQVLTWDVSLTLESLESQSFHFNVDVGLGIFGGGAIDVTGTATDATVYPLSQAAFISVYPTADFEVTGNIVPDVIPAGTNSVVNATVTNNGPDAVTRWYFYTNVPTPDMTFIESDNPDPVHCMVSFTNVNCNFGPEFGDPPLNPGESHTFEFPVHVQGNAIPGQYDLYYSTNANGQDPNYDNNQLQVPFTITESADLAVTKTLATSTAIAGSQVSYTIVVTNNGLATATNVQIVDAGGSGITPISVDNSNCTVTAGTGMNCTIPSIANGDAVTLNLVGALDPSSAGTTVSNSVNVSSDTADPDTSNNTATADTDPDPNANIQVTKQAGPVVAGRTTFYSAILQNLGPSLAHDVTLTDVVPVGLTFNSALSTPGCVLSGSDVACTLGDLLPGSQYQRSLQLAFDVPATLAAGTAITNTATGTSSDPTDDTSNSTATTNSVVARETNLSISKTDSSDPVAAGAPISYTITVHNQGPSDATNVLVSDTLSNAVTFVSASGATCTGGPALECTIASIPSGTDAVVTINGTVDAGAPQGGTITNVAEVAATEAETDPNTNDNSATDITDVINLSALSVSKTDSADPVVAGSSFSYVIHAANNGPSNANNVVVTDNLPAEVTVGTPTTDAGSCTLTPPSLVTCTLGNLTATQDVTITIPVTVLPSVAAGTSIINNVTSTIDGVVSDSAGEASDVTRSADLTVTKALQNGPIVAGQPATWLVTVHNSGPSDSSGFTLTDLAETSSLALTSATGPGSCTINGSAVCTVPSLANGADAVFTITGTVTPDTTGTIQNSVVVHANDPGDITNVTSSDPSTQEADLSLQKSLVNSGDIVNGSTVQYLLAVHNNGPSDATGVQIVDALPVSMTFDAANSSPGCVAVLQTVTCALPTIGNGGNSSVIIGATATASGTFLNTATVSSDATDGASGNDASALNTTVLPSADVSVTKTSLTATPTAGGNISYSIVAGNTGPDNAQNVVVTDAIPAGTSVVSATSGVGSCTTVSVITCTIPSLGSSSTEVTITVVLAIDPDFVPIGLAVQPLANTVSVSSDAHDPDESNNTTSITDTVQRTAPLTISKTAIPNPVVAGTDVVYAVTVHNAGPSYSDAFAISDNQTVHPLNRRGLRAGTDVRCIGEAPTICSDLAGIAPGGDSTFILVKQVDPTLSTGSTVLNSASILSTPDQERADPTSTDNNATIESDVSAIFDAAINLAFDPGTVDPGGSSNLNVTLTNTGPSAANNAHITLTLPDGLTLQPPVKGIPGSCTLTGPKTATCDVPTIMPGDTIAFQIPVIADSGVVGPVALTASGSVSVDDEVNIVNNFATAVLNVTSGPPVTTTLPTEVLGVTLGAPAAGNGNLAKTGFDAHKNLIIALWLLGSGAVTLLSRRKTLTKITK